MYIKLFLIITFSFLTIILIILLIKKQSKIIKPEIDYHLGDGIFNYKGYSFIFSG